MLVYAQGAFSVPQCILPVYIQYTLNTLEFDLGAHYLALWELFPDLSGG